VKTLKLVLITSMLAGCGVAVQDYDLKALADKCGSYDELRSVWMDMATPRARCKDGKRID